MLSWRWFRTNMLAGLIFLTVLTGFTVWVILDSQAGFQADVLPFFISMAVLIYAGACSVFNRSTVSIDKTGISARNGPLPSHLRNRRIELSQAHDFQVHRLDWFGLSLTLPHQLRMRTNTADTVRVAGGIPIAEQANYIETVLSRLVSEDLV